MYSRNRPPMWSQPVGTVVQPQNPGANNYQRAVPGANQPPQIRQQPQQYPNQAPNQQPTQRTQNQAPNQQPMQNPQNQAPSQPPMRQYQNQMPPEQNVEQPRNPRNNGYNQPPEQTRQAPPSNAPGNTGKTAVQPTEYISRKIFKINGRDKVVDFNGKLVKALPKDFANIHGCGGSNHAPNSTIGITICDFSKGAGKNSVTVDFAVDVEDIMILYQAAMGACMGTLRPETGNLLEGIVSASRQLNSWKKFPRSQDGGYVIPGQALNAMANTLNTTHASAKVAYGTPVYQYSREKNHGAFQAKNGMAPVKKIEITYSPTRPDGSPSAYPWFIGIENYDAPVKTRNNGAVTHSGSQAINKRSAFINLSAGDFAAALVAVSRYIRVWEDRVMGSVVEDGIRSLEAQREERNRQNA